MQPTVNLVNVSGRIYQRIQSGRWKYLRKRDTQYSWVYPGSQLHKALDACADLQARVHAMIGHYEVSV